MVSGTNRMRDKEGMGLWECRGHVAGVGWGRSYIDRCADGVMFDGTCCDLTMETSLKAITDGGLS